MRKSTSIVMAHPKTGAVLTQNTKDLKKNPDLWTARIDQTVTSLEGGLVTVSNRAGFISGKKAALESLGLKVGDVMPGNIRIIESYEPQYPGHKCKINPTTKADFLLNGKKVYRQYKYTEAGFQDIIIDKENAGVEQSSEVVLHEEQLLN